MRHPPALGFDLLYPSIRLHRHNGYSQALASFPGQIKALVNDVFLASVNGTQGPPPAFLRDNFDLDLVPLLEYLTPRCTLA